ncbi:MAG: amino acid ABC transporter permease [bacterium]|nr:MAG: amino acid ABC transporter permease [bacterium]
MVTGCQKPSDKNKINHITIGSKKFTEYVVLEEIIGRLLESEKVRVSHKKELGGTRFLWSAIIKGDIDLYPEYTGTITQEIFAGKGIEGNVAIRRALNSLGIRMTSPLGFNNTYGLGMKKDIANKLNIHNISDLRNHPSLKFGFGNEFMNRKDGWPGLRRSYELQQKDVRGLDHDLAYQGLESNSIQVIDLYMTDAEIRYYDLKVLKDDLKYFPAYDAVLLYRADTIKRIPSLAKTLERLKGKISAGVMVKMNSDVKSKTHRKTEAQVAAEFLDQYIFKGQGVQEKVVESTLTNRFVKYTKEHLILVGISLLGAILVAIPLGIMASKYPRVGQVILSFTGLVQTVPSLVLLVFMIPLMGIGEGPAIISLFLYSLLPIVRGTYTGIQEISSGIRESARAIGLPFFAILRLIELPLASRSILSGIKTSGVINVGTATLGALIGAGGYGQPILTGLRLDDYGLILEGAIPAAMMALLIQWGFDLSERLIVPKGLRIKSE